MTGSDPVAQTLDVPAARLYYERQGDGPLLLMIGSPMDSTGFAGLASALADRYTVVTYEPRGIGLSTREDATQDVTPEQQADGVVNPAGSTDAAERPRAAGVRCRPGSLF